MHTSTHIPFMLNRMFLEGCEACNILCEWLLFIPATIIYTLVSMDSSDEPKSTNSSTPAATSTNTTTAATGSGHAPTCSTSDRDGDTESGFSHEWILNHEENAARRQREIREASNGQQRDPEYRTFPQQQQVEMDDEEREYQHRRCDFNDNCSQTSTNVYIICACTLLPSYVIHMEQQEEFAFCLCACIYDIYVQMSTYVLLAVSAG
jgi:hypothetical protein